MKAIFPNARVPLESDLTIITDKSDSTVSDSAGSFIVGFVVFIVALLISRHLIFSFIFSIGVTIIIYYFSIRTSANQNRVKLENIEFEKLFDVKCTDQVTSRMILTPAFMNRIVEFVKKTGNTYEFLFQENSVYIKRHINGTYLEA